jgi:hypothetical protein
MPFILILRRLRERSGVETPVTTTTEENSKEY